MQTDFSIWSGYDPELSPEELVLVLEKRNMHVCELSTEHGSALLAREGDPETIGKQYRAYAAMHGVHFPQGHVWLTAHICDGNSATIDRLKGWISLYAGIGVRNAVLHCDESSFPAGTGTEDMIRANAQALQPLIRHAEPYGIRICLENLVEHLRTAEDLLAVIDLAGGSDRLGICLDTGHLNLGAPGTESHFIHRAGGRLHALHINDNEGRADQHLLPFSRGNVDFSAVMRALQDIGYEDLFNFEIPGERCPVGLVREAKVEYIGKIAAYLHTLSGEETPAYGGCAFLEAKEMP